MKKITSFDVLVVYSSKWTTSASSKKYSGIVPFKKGHTQYNEVYAYFLDMCAKNNVNAALTTTEDIVGSGTCKSYWLFKENAWVKVNSPCKSLFIFDKFFPTSKNRIQERDMLFSKKNVKAFISSHLFSLFHDKYRTHQELSKYAIPTVAINGNSIIEITKSLEKLKETIKNHANKDDFLENIILKDRYGAGGYNVHQIEKDFAVSIQNIMKEKEKLNYVIQPFVQFENGFQYKDYKGFTEIRLIYLGQKVVQTYIRVAGDEDFLCNHGQCAIAISRKDIPRNVISHATKIARQLNKKNALFALDFVVSNNQNVYLLEGNTSPGLGWYSDFPGNEKMNKKMINIISEELSRRVTLYQAQIINQRLLYPNLTLTQMSPQLMS